MAKKAMVLMADGFEEVEAITPIDYLRRVGIEVCTASIGDTVNVTSARSIEVKADTTLSELKKSGKLDPVIWDAVIVPGGLPGSDNLAASDETGDFLKKMSSSGRLVAAICAAPARVLSPLGLLTGKNFTSFPGEEEKVLAAGSPSAGAVWKKDRVVLDGNIITSRGAGTAGEFSCAIISYLLSSEEAKNLADKVLLYSA